MVPQSATMFQFRGAALEFVANENGEITHLVAHVVEGDFKGPRVKKRPIDNEQTSLSACR
jgi:hypothetical protein